MIISGPNAGGKTVALKALGIVVLMAQAGIPVPADEVKLPLFGRVLADIGDQQSIAANLSTFSAHVTNIEAMAEVVGPNDLVLLDEIGASTEPNEGAALAVAILEHFRQRGAMTVVTTHHSRLKAYAAETAEAVNAAMEFDEATLEPTYRLLVGLPGKSSALDIAARLGLESSIVEKARSLLHPADAEAAALVAGLHQQRTEMERKLEETGSPKAGPGKAPRTIGAPIPARAPCQAARARFPPGRHVAAVREDVGTIPGGVAQASRARQGREPGRAESHRLGAGSTRGMEHPGSGSAGRARYDAPRASGGAADGGR